MRTPPPHPPPPQAGQIPVKFRSFVPVNKKGVIEHLVIIKDGPKDGSYDIKIRAGTEDSFDSLNIVKATNSKGSEYKFEKDTVKNVPFVKGRADINVKFSGNEKYSLNIEAYESK